MLNSLLAVNRELCNRIEPVLPQAKINIFNQYEQLVAKYMNLNPNQVIIDVGGGKSCPFSKYRKYDLNTKIIAVDISDEELKFNNDVDEKLVANTMQGLPFGDNEVDIIASRSVLEHIEDLEKFISNTKKSLKKGGYFIHLLPSKFAPFSLLNQLIPNKISKKLLNALIPESKGIQGFPAFYDKCYHSSIKSLLEMHGFEICETKLSYYQSGYFKFFFPFYFLSALFEILLFKFNIKNLCSYILVVAKKK